MDIKIKILYIFALGAQSYYKKLILAQLKCQKHNMDLINILNFINKYNFGKSPVINSVGRPK